MRIFYLAMCFVGTVVPWAFFVHFFAQNGVDPALFISSLFANGAAGGFSADVMISIGVFWVWSLIDARKLGIDRWWLVLPSGALVGLSLALPLYLFLRSKVSSV